MTVLNAAADAELGATVSAAGGGGAARHPNACCFPLPERGSAD